MSHKISSLCVVKPYDIFKVNEDLVLKIYKFSMYDMYDIENAKTESVMHQKPVKVYNIINNRKQGKKGKKQENNRITANFGMSYMSDEKQMLEHKVIEKITSDLLRQLGTGESN